MGVSALDISLGKHYIIECYDCDIDVLCSPEQLETIFMQAANLSGATVISSHFNQFDPQGVSGVVVIAESHFTVHTWPEHRYAAVDIFTCGASIDFDIAMQVMKTGLRCREMITSGKLDRGLMTGERLLRAESFPTTKTHATMSYKQKFDAENAWGLLTSLDIHDCDPDIIRDGEAIKRYAVELSDYIDMKRFGETIVVDFGESERVAGYRHLLVQVLRAAKSCRLQHQVLQRQKLHDERGGKEIDDVRHPRMVL